MAGVNYKFQFDVIGVGNIVRARNAVQNLGQTVWSNYDTMARKMQSFERIFAGAAMGGGMAMMGKWLVQNNAQLQANQILLESIVGNAEKAQELTSFFQKTAANYGVDQAELFGLGKGFVYQIGNSTKAVKDFTKLALTLNAIQTENRGIGYVGFSLLETLQGVGPAADFRSFKSRLELNFGEATEKAIFAAVKSKKVELAAKLLDEALAKKGISFKNVEALKAGALTIQGSRMAGQMKMFWTTLGAAPTNFLGKSLSKALNQTEGAFDPENMFFKRLKATGQYFVNSTLQPMFYKIGNFLKRLTMTDWGRDMLSQINIVSRGLKGFLFDGIGLFSAFWDGFTGGAGNRKSNIAAMKELFQSMHRMFVALKGPAETLGSILMSLAKSVAALYGAGANFVGNHPYLGLPVAAAMLNPFGAMNMAGSAAMGIGGFALTNMLGPYMMGMGMGGGRRGGGLRVGKGGKALSGAMIPGISGPGTGIPFVGNWNGSMLAAAQQAAAAKAANPGLVTIPGNSGGSAFTNVMASMVMANLASSSLASTISLVGGPTGLKPKPKMVPYVNRPAQMSPIRIMHMGLGQQVNLSPTGTGNSGSSGIKAVNLQGPQGTLQNLQFNTSSANRNSSFAANNVSFPTQAARGPFREFLRQFMMTMMASSVFSILPGLGKFVPFVGNGLGTGILGVLKGAFARVVTMIAGASLAIAPGLPLIIGGLMVLAISRLLNSAFEYFMTYFSKEWISKMQPLIQSLQEKAEQLRDHVAPIRDVYEQGQDLRDPNSPFAKDVAAGRAAGGNAGAEAVMRKHGWQFTKGDPKKGIAAGYYQNFIIASRAELAQFTKLTRKTNLRYGDEILVPLDQSGAPLQDKIIIIHKNAGPPATTGRRAVTKPVKR